MPKSTATPTGDIDLIVLGRSTGLSRLILQVAKARQLTVRQLPFERIATHARIEDCLATGGTNIRWEFDHSDGPGIISPENVRGVFCYGDIPRHMRTDVVKEDIDYVHHEIVAYLGFALSQFASVINKPFSGSLTGYTDTLPYQWNILTLQGVAGVRVPKYDITTRLVPRDGMVYSVVAAPDVGVAATDLFAL
jgi:hypothetical protein